MPQIPQARRYAYQNDADYGTDEWYRNLARHYRQYNHAYPDLFGRDKSDWEVIENLRHNFGYHHALKEAPSSILQEHNELRGIKSHREFPEESDSLGPVVGADSDTSEAKSKPDNFGKELQKGQ